MLKTIVDHAKPFAAIGFFIGSWVLICFLSQSLRFVAILLLIIPWYLCGEWLAERVFHPDSILSVKNSPLSVTRIIAATVVATAVLLLLISFY